LLSIFALGLGWLPPSLGYDQSLIPNLSWNFISSIIRHYHLPWEFSRNRREEPKEDWTEKFAEDVAHA